MDLNKLTPAPWESSNLNWRNEDAGFDRYIHGNIIEDDEDCHITAVAVAIVKGNATSGTIQDANAEFIALARNAFDVMMRRGPDWIFIERDSDKFLADCPDIGFIPGRFTDPFTAWVEADKWYRENIELKPPSSPPPVAPGTTPSISPNG